ncbi:MAG: signal peptidase I [bacterium]|nr:signal peptidase I [bacterium]
MDNTPPVGPHNKRERKSVSFLKDLVKYALTAIIIVVPIRLWVAQPFVVNGSSMDNTFRNGQYLIVDELTYRFREPERGEVVIFRYPKEPSKYFIKRLVGLPGETVMVRDDKVTIRNDQYPDGVLLSEPYAQSRTFGNVTVTLKADEYFVMGDNRVVSSDSRVWGPLPKDDIIGRPIVRLMPLSRMGMLPGAVSTSTIIQETN